MSGATNIWNKIRIIANEAQQSCSLHQKCNAHLNKIYKENDMDEFFEAFRNYLIILLRTKYKPLNEHAQRSLEFCALFSSSICSEKHEEESFLHKMFLYLLKNQNLDDDVVRYRCCELINLLFNHLVGNELSPELYNSLEDALLERVNDSRIAIRLQAINALSRLQDPTANEDPVINIFIVHMQGDPSAKVRKLCVEKIASTRIVMPFILMKTRDVDASVRLAAFMKASKIPNYFAIIERQAILKNGFRDSTAQIRLFVSKQLISNWLIHYDNDCLKLLEALRLDSDEEEIAETIIVIELLLFAIFSQKPIEIILEYIKYNNQYLLPYEKLNWDSALYWRCVVDYFRKIDKNHNILDEILPEVVPFCAYIEEYCTFKTTDMKHLEFAEHQFILKQLFLILTDFDLDDVASRECLSLTVKYLLKNFDLIYSSIYVIVKCLENPKTHIDHCSEFFHELVFDMLYSTEDKSEKLFEISQLKFKLNLLKDEQNEAINSKEFLRAEDLKLEILEMEKQISRASVKLNEKKVDVVTLEKCLNIIAAHLSSSKVKKLSYSLQKLKTDVIDESLLHPNESVRCVALKSFGLCCYVDKDCAVKGIHILSAPILFYQSGNECDVEMLLISIPAVADLLMIYGTELIVSPETVDLSESCDEQKLSTFAGGTTLTIIIQGLIDLLNDENPELQEKAGHSLCNLIISGRVNSSSVFSRMILKWCNPASEDQYGLKLNQRIALMLQNLPKIPNTGEQFQKAIIQTIKVVLRAPRTSPLSEVDVNNLAKFMLQLCRAYENGSYLHSYLAVSVLDAMKKDKHNLIYGRMLLMLEIPKDISVVDDLLALSEGVLDYTKERLGRLYLIKFRSALSILKNSDEVIISEENETMRN